MPLLNLLTLDEAMVKSATKRRAEVAKEYLDYIGQLRKGQAGKLQAGEGETIAAVRRRLGAAAKFTGKKLVIKRAGDELYFWAQPRAPSTGQRRRGRPPKAA